MKLPGCRRVWDGWSAIQSLELGRRTGRLAAFYNGRHHIFLDLTGGIISAVYLSERQLRIEQVLIRIGTVTPGQVQQAFHRLGQIDRITPLSHVLLEQGALTGEQLAVARQHQMTQVLQTVMRSERDALMFIPGPSGVQKIETVISIGDAVATAFAEIRKDAGTEHPHRDGPASESESTTAEKRRFSIVWSDPTPDLTRQAR